MQSHFSKIESHKELHNFPLNCGLCPGKIRLAIVGEQGVGKSALTVRYLTRRYIGEYKSDSDMKYRQSLTISNKTTLEVEILDVSSHLQECDMKNSSENTRVPEADAYIVVYSITDKNSYKTALSMLKSISNSIASQNSYFESSSFDSLNESQNNISLLSTSPSSNSSFLTSLTGSSSVALVGNKADLEHLRTVEKMTAASASAHYGASFYELSVAENSSEVQTCFHAIISSLSSQKSCNDINRSSSKRRFSVSKMFGNVRLGKSGGSPTPKITSSSVSIVDTDCSNLESMRFSCNISSLNSLNSSSMVDSQSFLSLVPKAGRSYSFGRKPQGSSEAITNSLCNLKAKLKELHTIRKRHNSPIIYSL